MSDPKALTWEEQADLFKMRGLKIEARDIKKLKHISYYRLKEFAKPFEKRDDSNQLYYIDTTFSEVLKRYYQDKNLRMDLLHAIEKIEVSLKTKVSNILGLQYGPFGYLNFPKWVNRQKYSRYEVEKQQYHIKKNLLIICRKSHSNALKSPENIDKDGFPSVWIGIDLLMLGDLVKIIELLNKKSSSLLIAEYDCSKEELISWLKCLNFIRNICAHNANLIDIQLQTKPKMREDWEPYLIVRVIKEHGRLVKRYTNRLAVVIMIMKTLVEKINPSYDWSRIQRTLCTLSNHNESRAQLLGFQSYGKIKQSLPQHKTSKRNRKVLKM